MKGATGKYATTRPTNMRLLIAWTIFLLIVGYAPSHSPGSKRTVHLIPLYLLPLNGPPLGLISHIILNHKSTTMLGNQTSDDNHNPNRFRLQCCVDAWAHLMDSHCNWYPANDLSKFRGKAAFEWFFLPLNKGKYKKYIQKTEKKNKSPY